MKYRIVNVYTGYAENSIERVNTFDHFGDVESAAKLVETSNQTHLLNDGADYSEIQEFFTGVNVIGDIASVVNGEENTFLVIPETSVWFDRVLDEHGVFTNHLDEWNDLIDGHVFSPGN